MDDGVDGVDHSRFHPELADSVVANDLNKMTAEQRNIVFDDIHGVRKLRPEETSPPIMLESLERMNIAIQGIESKRAFDEASRLNSQYVLRDKQFRVRFLRADEYDVFRAAQRFVNYLDVSYEYFGVAALMRPIYIDDLDGKEQALLREGCQQLLPCRDRMGRRIMSRIGNIGGGGSQTTPACMRINLYFLQEMSNDETTQQFGVVWILLGGFAPGETTFLKEPNVPKTIRKFLGCFPLKFTAIHLCFPKNATYQFASAAISLIAPTFMRVRVRTHFGSQTEWKYSLMAYGIPADQLPMTASGGIKTANHVRWMKTQREREISIKMGLPPFEGVDCPRVMDILIGNNAGQCFRNNPGNTVYREVMESYFEKYWSASDTQEKTRITWMVLEELSRAGGRILVRSRRGWWSVANPDKAREKISQDFRETRKRLLATKKRSQMETSTSAFTGLDGKRTRLGSVESIVDGAGCRRKEEKHELTTGGCINLCSNTAVLSKKPV